MSLRHKKRHPDAVSKTHNRKMLVSALRRAGKLKPGESSSPFSMDQLRSMAGAG